MCKHKPPNNFKINCTALLTPPHTKGALLKKRPLDSLKTLIKKAI